MRATFRFRCDSCGREKDVAPQPFRGDLITPRECLVGAECPDCGGRMDEYRVAVETVPTVTGYTTQYAPNSDEGPES